jgi:hypothetical protein
VDLRKAARLQTRMGRGNRHASSTLVYVLEKSTLTPQRELIEADEVKTIATFGLNLRAGVASPEPRGL